MAIGAAWVVADGGSFQASRVFLASVVSERFETLSVVDDHHFEASVMFAFT